MPTSLDTGLVNGQRLDGSWTRDAAKAINALTGQVYDVKEGATPAKGDGVTDDTTAIQARIEAAYAIGGGRVYLPPGTYLTGPLTLKYKVSLCGATPQNLNELATIAVATVLKLKNGSDAPLITTDQVNGHVRAASVVGPGNQLYQNSTIEHLGLDGNKAGQTSMDADLIRAHQVWNLTVKNCYGVNAKGFGLRALDCNVLTVRHNSFIGTGGLFLEAISDTLIQGNQLGGGNGLVYPVVWVSSPGEFAWQSIVSENFVFNNANNAAIFFPTATVVAATDLWTTSSAHGWVDGTPVIVTTTGTLPAGLVAGRTYYADVQSATTLKLCASRAALATATYVDITDTGSGTHTIQTGENCNVYIGDTSYTKWLLVSDNRIDQGYGHGIVVDGAKDCAFEDNLILGNGLANATGQYGIFFRNGATGNRVAGGVIDGTVYASGGNNTKQTVGVYADDTSFGTHIDPTTHVRNHSTSNVRVPNYSGEVEYLSFGTDRFEAISGTPALATIGGARRNAWLFDAAAAEIVNTECFFPVGWRTIRIKLYWVNAGAGSGDVAWNALVGSFAVGANLNVVDGNTTNTVITTAGAQDVLTQTVLTPDFSITEGGLVFLRVQRVAADAGDTLANDAGLVAVRIERVL